jgi:hypothetical protein
MSFRKPPAGAAEAAKVAEPKFNADDTVHVKMREMVPTGIRVHDIWREGRFIEIDPDGFPLVEFEDGSRLRLPPGATMRKVI